MASRKSSGDMVLGGRHLVGIFLLLVVVFAIVFTLGYLLGRSQYDSQIQAASRPDAATARPASVPDKPAAKITRTATDHQATPPPTNWDFYRSNKPARSPARLMPPPKKRPVAKRSSARTRPAPKNKPRRARVRLPRADRSLAAPWIPRGATVLQVAALTHQADALALAQVLQKKRFPAFVLTPGSDNFYRVQVGPYPNTHSANVARIRLEKQGFKTITRR